MRRRVYYCGLAHPRSLSSLYLVPSRRHSRDKISQALSRFSMSRSSKVTRIINAYSGEGLGTRLTRKHVLRKIEDEEEISLETCRIDV